MNRYRYSSDKHKRNAYQNECDEYLKDLGDTHFFDVNSQIYKPNSCKPVTQAKDKSAGASKSSPLFVEPAADGCMIALAAFSACVAFVTLLVVGIYTFASYGQWEQMRITTRELETPRKPLGMLSIKPEITNTWINELGLELWRLLQVLTSPEAEESTLRWGKSPRSPSWSKILERLQL
jgi:hypothetical protein